MNEQAVHVKPLKGKERARFTSKYGSHVQAGRKLYALCWASEVVVDGVSVAGLCDSDKCILYINTSVEDVMATLLHEWVHSEIAESGIRQCVGWTRDMEEVLAETLSQGFCHNFNFKKR